jgi:hypothetical protein
MIGAGGAVTELLNAAVTVGIATGSCELVWTVVMGATVPNIGRRVLDTGVAVVGTTVRPKKDAGTVLEMTEPLTIAESLDVEPLDVSSSAPPGRDGKLRPFD